MNIHDDGPRSKCKINHLKCGASDSDCFFMRKVDIEILIIRWKDRINRLFIIFDPGGFTFNTNQINYLLVEDFHLKLKQIDFFRDQKEPIWEFWYIWLWIASLYSINRIEKSIPLFDFLKKPMSKCSEYRGNILETPMAVYGHFFLAKATNFMWKVNGQEELLFCKAFALCTICGAQSLTHCENDWHKILLCHRHWFRWIQWLNFTKRSSFHRLLSDYD